MNSREDLLCMDVLAAIAWADGEVSASEASTLVDLITRMEYADSHRVQETMFVPHNAPSAAQLETLDRKTRIRLLHDAYLVADYCGGVDEEELAIIKKVAATILPEDRWPDVHACLQLYASFERASEKLWGVTHLG